MQHRCISVSLLWSDRNLNFFLVKVASLNYFGERGARIDSKMSVFSPSVRQKRTLFFRFMTHLLFYMPTVYMEELERVWIDKTIDYLAWRKFITGLQHDWESSIIPVSPIPFW